MPTFNTIESSEDSATLSAANHRHLDPGNVITLSQTTQLQFFSAAEFSGVEFWAFDAADAQLFINGQAATGYRLDDNGSTGLHYVTLPAGTWYIGVQDDSLTGSQTNQVFDELSAVTSPGLNFIGNVPVAVSGNAGAWVERGFTITGNPGLYIETEGTGGEFMIMNDSQYHTFASANPSGYTGGSFYYTYALGGTSGGPSTEIEGQLLLSPGTWHLVWINNTGTWQGGAGNISGFGSGGSVQTYTTPPVTLHHIVEYDFNGDGRSDILWRNNSGTVTDWLGTANGSFNDNSANALTAAADNSWHVVGTGDFNGDGHSDILWRNSSGYLTEWLGTSTGGFTNNSANAANGSADGSWQVVGAGDFNGDGISDILWRNSSGYVTDWLGTSSGGFTNNSAFAASGSADSSWQVVGTGDFNGDGISDILWRNTSGYVTEWLGTSTGGFTDNGATAGNGSADGSWQVVGTGDFNGDGRVDILWRSSGGYVAEWLANSNGSFSANASAGNGSADNSWQIAQVGDFNGDGISDILWRSSGGYVTEWLGISTGSFALNASAGSGAADLSWHVQDPLL